MNDNKYGRVLGVSVRILSVLWSLLLLAFFCMIYPPYGMILSVKQSVRSFLLSLVPFPTLLISAALYLSAANEKKSQCSPFLLLCLGLLLCAVSFFTKEMPDLSYRTDLSSAAVFFLVPLFLVSCVRKKIKKKWYLFFSSIFFAFLLILSVILSFLPHILFQTLYDLYLLLPFSVSVSLLLLSAGPDGNQRTVIIASDLSLPIFIILRRFFSVDAIAFPSILFPASALLLAVLTARRLLKSKKTKNNPKNP